MTTYSTIIYIPMLNIISRNKYHVQHVKKAYITLLLWYDQQLMIFNIWHYEWLSRLRLSNIVVPYYTFPLMWIYEIFNKINVNDAPTNSYFPAIAYTGQALDHQMIYGNHSVCDLGSVADFARRDKLLSLSHTCLNNFIWYHVCQWQGNKNLLAHHWHLFY